MTLIDLRTDTLNKISWQDEDEPENVITYRQCKDYSNRHLSNASYMNSTPWTIAGGFLYYQCDDELEENGLSKFASFIASMLYLMKNDGFSHPYSYKFAYTVSSNIRDFDTGEYDYLVTEQDLIEMKSDIEIIRRYLNEHQNIKTVWND